MSYCKHLSKKVALVNNHISQLQHNRLQPDLTVFFCHHRTLFLPLHSEFGAALLYKECSIKKRLLKIPEPTAFFVKIVRKAQNSKYPLYAIHRISKRRFTKMTGPKSSKNYLITVSIRPVYYKNTQLYLLQCKNLI